MSTVSSSALHVNYALVAMGAVLAASVMINVSLKAMVTVAELMAAAARLAADVARRLLVLATVLLLLLVLVAYLVG